GAALRHRSMSSPETYSGLFFACRTRGGQRYWRYVQNDGTVILEEPEMLRRINPNAGTRVAPADLALDLEFAWTRAVRSIVEEHNLLADPRSYDERLGPVQRFALDLLRDPTVTLPGG